MSHRDDEPTRYASSAQRADRAVFYGGNQGRSHRQFETMWNLLPTDGQRLATRRVQRAKILGDFSGSVPPPRRLSQPLLPCKLWRCEERRRTGHAAKYDIHRAYF